MGGKLSKRWEFSNGDVTISNHLLHIRQFDRQISALFPITAMLFVDIYTTPCGLGLIALASTCQAQLILSGCFPK